MVESSQTELPSHAAMQAAKSRGQQAVEAEFEALKATGFGPYLRDWENGIQWAKEHFGSSQEDAEKKAWEDIVINSSVSINLIIDGAQEGHQFKEFLFSERMQRWAHTLYEAAAKSPNDIKAHLELIGIKAAFESLAISWPEGIPEPDSMKNAKHLGRVQRENDEQRGL